MHKYRFAHTYRSRIFQPFFPSLFFKMSHMTADLEYFKCDMCGVYMHRDIFCDHRRDCHGRDSTMLKRGECAKLSEELSRETRELLLAKESKVGAAPEASAATHSNSSSSSSGHLKADLVEAAATTSNPDGDKDDVNAKGIDIGHAKEKGGPAASHSSSTGSQCGGCTLISASVSAAELERRQEARTRRAVSDRYQAMLDAKIGALLTEEKKTSLMAFLQS